MKQDGRFFLNAYLNFYIAHGFELSIVRVAKIKEGLAIQFEVGVFADGTYKYHQLQWRPDDPRGISYFGNPFYLTRKAKSFIDFVHHRMKYWAPGPDGNCRLCGYGINK